MNSARHTTGFLFALAAAAGIAWGAPELAGYDSRGRIVALLSEGGEVEAYSNYVAVGRDGKRTILLERQIAAGPRNQGQLKSWSGLFGAPETGRFRIEWKTVDGDTGLRYSTTVMPETGAFQTVELVLDIPRDVFVNGRLTAGGGKPIALSAERGRTPALFSGTAGTLRFEDASGRIAIAVALDGGRDVSVIDCWDLLGAAHIIPNMPLDEGGQLGTMYYAKTRRSYQVRIPLVAGSTPAGTKAAFSGTFLLINKSVAPPARLAVDTGKPLYMFDGFGANFCWDKAGGSVHPIQEYLLEALKPAWGRTEMKITAWDRSRTDPPQDVRYDLGFMRRLQDKGIPYVISIWRLPDRFFADPATEPAGARGRAVNPSKWDELAALLTDYLLYARKEYGVEPDLFSFNEGNLGVNIRLTPREHTLQIKKFGAAFRQAGLKTRMLLGDAVPARDSHAFALDAAADPEAMQYIGGVAFHSWGGATPSQYAAWKDLADWLGLPLLDTELGPDSQVTNINAWDSYHYGLREAQHTQEVLLYAHPRGTQFWQYTDSYALVRALPGGSIEPTARFWLMKHFAGLTPHNSEALATSSDQAQTLLTAFRKNGTYVLHIVNRGGARDATISGAPDGPWRLTESTEAKQFQQTGGLRSGGGVVRLKLPARSLVTLISGDALPAN